MVCIHCGTAPVLRKDTATTRLMMMCPECKARGDVAIHEARARMSWDLVNDDTLPRHGCRNGSYPRFIQVAGKWGYGCKACGFTDTVCNTRGGYRGLDARGSSRLSAFTHKRINVFTQKRKGVFLY